MANPLEELVLVSANAPYLLASSLGEQEPSPLASLRGTKPGRFAPGDQALARLYVPQEQRAIALPDSGQLHLDRRTDCGSNHHPLGVA